ncbi:HutD/Ves family protein [Burkholderia sp. MR1-5-21]
MTSLIDVYPIESIPPEPWRNGGGVTKTIATGGAQWRVSLASIKRDGPYSRFPGISRVSVILSGNGVTLRDKDVVVQLRPLVTVAYDGDADWDATLVGRPCTALNVMSAKGRYRVNVQFVTNPVTVAPGCIAIAIALERGCIFTNGPDAHTSTVIQGYVLVSECHAYPLRLAPQVAAADKTEGKSYAVLVTIEPIPV